ncbi:MAG: RIP metalloprotease RseP, partial [Verrucomicrobia bacterium]|nr:RIP metalloprotease RseP [Verrucomicrobiota bacterium]
LAIIESVRRRPLSLKVQEYATTTFAVLLISFMLYVTFFDIKRVPLFKLMFQHRPQIEQTDRPASAPAPVPSVP